MITLSDVIGIVLAVVLGGAVGVEREVSGKAAGLRTNVLICLGAAVFTIISAKMALRYDASVVRIAAQIVTGVGFIGAGAIIQDRGGGSDHPRRNCCSDWPCKIRKVHSEVGSYTQIA